MSIQAVAVQRRSAFVAISGVPWNCDGLELGEDVGDALGLDVGDLDGLTDGLAVGLVLGLADGLVVGEELGDPVGGTVVAAPPMRSKISTQARNGALLLLFPILGFRWGLARTMIMRSMRPMPSPLARAVAQTRR